MEEKDKEAWDSFVDTHPEGHPSFLSAWRKVFKEAFGHEHHFALAEDDSGSIVGILPLVHIRSLLFGSALISVPYINGGGILALHDEAASELLCFARRLSVEKNTNYIELRQRKAEEFLSKELEEKSHKVSMLLELQSNPEMVFKGFSSKLRSQIRRPSKDGVTAKVAGQDLPTERSVEAFYTVFSKNMRDLGTPVYPRRLFTSAMRHFGQRARLISVWYEGNPAAAGLTIGSGRTAEILWASSLRRYSRQAPNMLLYWESIKTAVVDGYEVFDFGRCSLDGGSYKFKKQWGSSPQSLHWYYDIRKGDIPDISPGNSRFSTLVQCWKKLPIPVANSLGPWITKSLP